MSARTTPRAALALVLAATLLGGCTGAPKRDPDFAATLPVAMPRPEPQYAGAIYQAGYNVVLFEDLRARRPGDLLTIRLQESTIASKDTEATVSRSNSTSVSEPTLLGTSAQFDLPNVVPLANQKNLGLATELESSSEFSGGGDASQSNSLSGEITVTVAEVLPNGNLLVRGEKRLNLTEGNEYVKISGIVRPNDIGADNSVPSSRVADATIVYAGDGQSDAATKIGWLARFFASAFFPF